MSELSNPATTGRRAPMRFVWQMDAEHRFTVGSDAFVAMMGRTTAAVLGRPWGELAAALALDPEQQVALALASQETWSGLHVAWPVDDGAERLIVELSGLPIFDRDRVFRGYRGFGICRDATRHGGSGTESPVAIALAENIVPLRPAREPAAPALNALERNAFQELTRRLNERLASVSPPVEIDHASSAPAAQEAASAGNSAKQAAARRLDFLARLSHEIRNPLNAIIGFSEVMAQEKLGPLGNEHYRQYVGDIHACGLELLSLVNDLLDLSKIEADKLDLDLAGVDLNPLIRQCVAALQPQAQRARVIIRTALSPTLPCVLADARALRQIVRDLVSQSTKLAGAGGQVIASTTRNDRGEVILRIRVNGTAMSEGELAFALAPLRPSATSRRQGMDGGGLGLPLAKALLEANGAALSIKCAAPVGTLIEITFPRERVLAGGMP